MKTGNCLHICTALKRGRGENERKGHDSEGEKREVAGQNEERRITRMCLVACEGVYGGEKGTRREKQNGTKGRDIGEVNCC